MSCIHWKNTENALKSGLKTYGDLPQTDSTMDRKSFLLNTGKNYPQEVNNLMNNKVRWAFVGDKGVVTTGNQQFLDEPGTEELKTTGGLPPTFITPALLGMNEGADSQIVVVPKIFPLDLGETIPFGHSLENLLPICNLYPEGFTAWFATLH